MTDYLDTAAVATTETIKARNLIPWIWLADEALVTHLSFQRSWIYARIVKDGHARTRRYKHDQDVKVMQYTP